MSDITIVNSQATLLAREGALIEVLRGTATALEAAFSYACAHNTSEDVIDKLDAAMVQVRPFLGDAGDTADDAGRRLADSLSRYRQAASQLYRACALGALSGGSTRWEDIEAANETALAALTDAGEQQAVLAEAMRETGEFTFLVSVEALVERSRLDRDDRDGVAGKFTFVLSEDDVPGDAVETGLDYFHNNMAIAVLDDFDIRCELVLPDDVPGDANDV